MSLLSRYHRYIEREFNILNTSKDKSRFGILVFNKENIMASKRYINEVDPTQYDFTIFAELTSLARMRWMNDNKDYVLLLLL